MSKNPKFNFIIRTPEGGTLDAQVESISLTTDGGDLQCFSGHAALTGSVAFSPVVIEMGEHQETYMVRNGMFLFDNKTDKASLLVLSAEKKAEMQMSTVKEYHDFIVEKLKSGEDLSEYQIKYLEGEQLAVEQQIDMVQE
ncbi:MAG: F0F1-type ATP synthase epsilon subunit [Oceanicoccus sp.]|jgi:F0F1-type ATP synthase epsilon subunit